MRAVVALSPLLLFPATAAVADDNGAVRMGGNWITYGIHRGGAAGDSAGPPGRSGAGALRNCRSIPGESPNNYGYVQCDAGPRGQENLFNAVGPADPGVSAITPEMLMEQALRRLAPPTPKIATAPPRDKTGYVGLRQFFWAEPGQWREMSKKATAGPVWAEVTATPTKLTIEPGAGQKKLTCTGPGVPYDEAKSPDEQNIQCSHVFTQSSAGLPNSRYPVKVLVIWSADWTGSGGVGGTLPPITTSTTFPLRIGEAPALVGRNS